MIKLREKAKMLPMRRIYSDAITDGVYNAKLIEYFVEIVDDGSGNLVSIFETYFMPNYPLCFSMKMNECTSAVFRRLVEELDMSVGGTYDLSVFEQPHEFYLRLTEYNGQVVVNDLCFFDDRGCIEDGDCSIYKSEVIDVVVAGKKASSLYEYDKEELQDNDVELVYHNSYLSDKNGILSFFDGTEILDTPVEVLRKLNILKDNGKYDLRPLKSLYYVEDIYYDGELCETRLVDLY